MTLKTFIDSRLGRSRGSRIGAAVLAVLGASAMLEASAGPASTLTLVRFNMTPFPTVDAVAQATNACVDAVSASDLKAAERLCSEAIHAARAARSNVLTATYNGSGLRQDLAIAYNNRAVVRQLSGDVDAAKQDSARAIALADAAPWARDTSARIAAGPSKSVRVAAQAMR